MDGGKDFKSLEGALFLGYGLVGGREQSCRSGAPSTQLKLSNQEWFSQIFHFLKSPKSTQMFVLCIVGTILT